MFADDDTNAQSSGHETSSPGGGETSSPGGGHGSNLRDPLSAGRKQYFPKSRKKKGKRQRFGDKVPPAGQEPRHWRDCEKQLIDDVTDRELVEYFIRYSLEFTLPQDYYPKDKGQWVKSCSDTAIASAQDVAKGFTRGSLLLIGIIISGPNSADIGHSIKVPISGRSSIRSVIKEARPDAKAVNDIIRPAPKPRQRFKASAVARACMTVITGTTKQRLQTSMRNECTFVAFTGLMQMIAMQQRYCFKSVLQTPEHKTQFESRSRDDVQDWINAEWIEMDTVY